MKRALRRNLPAGSTHAIFVIVHVFQKISENCRLSNQLQVGCPIISGCPEPGAPPSESPYARAFEKPWPEAQANRHRPDALAALPAADFHEACSMGRTTLRQPGKSRRTLGPVLCMESAALLPPFEEASPASLAPCRHGWTSVPWFKSPKLMILSLFRGGVTSGSRARCERALASSSSGRAGALARSRPCSRLGTRNTWARMICLSGIPDLAPC